MPREYRTAGPTGRHGDDAACTQHYSGSGVPCTLAIGECDHLTEDNTTHTSGPSGLCD